MTPPAKLRFIYLLPLAIVLIVGSLFAVFHLKRDNGGMVGAGKPGMVVAGGHYYVFIRSLEVAAKKPSGKAWDGMVGEAPDLYYEVHWRDNCIFTSETLSDQLIGNWSPLGVDTIKSIREGRISVSSVIKAAAIRAAPNESFEIRVYDDDPVSQDTIARLSFAFDDLKEGDNEFVYEAGDSHSVTYLRLSVVNADLPLMAQVEQILNP